MKFKASINVSIESIIIKNWVILLILPIKLLGLSLMDRLNYEPSVRASSISDGFIGSLVFLVLREVKIRDGPFLVLILGGFLDWGFFRDGILEGFPWRSFWRVLGKMLHWLAPKIASYEEMIIDWSLFKNIEDRFKDHPSFSAN